MKTGAFCWLLVGAFAAAVGHLAWHTLVGPPIVPDYFVGGRTPALAAPEPGAKQLYLRREVYVPRRPHHAWLAVVSHDQVVVYVNGRHVAEQAQDGFDVAAVVDLAPAMRPGRNVIGIVSEQARIDTPPEVAIDGAYTLDDGAHPLRSDESWRCRTVLERRGTWWFEPEFRDRHWAFARVTDRYPTAKVTAPPRASTVNRLGHWITPPALAESSAAIRREFDLAGRPRQAWLRVVATASYSLAVNDVVIDRTENRLDTTTVPVAPIERRYDLTPMLRRGRNVVAFLLTSPAGPPHVRIDGEVDDVSGARCLLSSDEQWLGRGGLPAGWSRATPPSVEAWQPCAVDPGYLDIMPWEPSRQIGTVTLPADALLERVGGELVLILAIALATALACRLASRLLPAGAVYLALLPPALAIGLGCLAVFDPRVAAQEVYRPEWVFVAVAAVLGQWGGFALAAVLGRRRAKMPVASGGEQPSDEVPTDESVVRSRLPLWVIGLLVGLLVVGFWLRIRHLATEPLDGDETQEYREAMGLLERGYPSFVIDNDLPVRRLCTSELVAPGQALTALVTRDDCYVVRFPALVAGVLSILLIFVTGRHLFGTAAGLTAAALYTFSPNCVQMSNFGRYPSQVQFFALLTVYLFWRIIEGNGPIRRWAVWLTVASFTAMYLSWEPSALIALGMMLAALVQRRGRLRTILGEPSVWMGMAVIVSVIVLQLSHRRLVQMQYQTYLIEHDDARVTLLPMWQYPGFDILFYVRGGAWTVDTLLPLLGLVGGLGLTLTVRDRRPALALGIIFLVTCFIMVGLLPVKAWRYGYYLIPLVILLSAAALSATGRGLIRLVDRYGGKPYTAYARATVVVSGLVLVAVASGVTLQFPELTTFRGAGYTLDVLKFPDLRGPVAYLQAHLEEGDVVITSQPHVVDHLMRRSPDGPSRAGWKCDYWIESKVYYVAVLDDRGEQPLHRRSGQVLIHPTYPFTDNLDVVFARPGRIWFLVYKGMDAMQNDPEVASYLRQYMDVVYEDFSTVVMLRDSENRPASMRHANEEALKRARANYLP